MNLLRWSECSATERVAALRRPAAQNAARVRDEVCSIVARVRQGGDEAIFELTQRLDGALLSRLQVTGEEIGAAKRAVDPMFVSDMKEAIASIRRFHQAQRPSTLTIETSPGVRCERRFVPIERVGLYVPGGTAPLPSTVVMLAIPAEIAGCALRVLATPPKRDGSIDAHILVTADLLGVREIFKVGGAQAIAALAYGTASIPKVDKIFGPGNAWVTEAKLQVSQDPGGAAIDLPAGPSEVMVIADGEADATFVAADLLAQAEHGVDSQVVLVSNSSAQLGRVQEAIAEQLPKLERREIAAAALAHSVTIEVDNLPTAIEVCNLYAPEHLILQVAEPHPLVGQIKNAGSVFLGRWTPESMGDYASGTNHVLPTYGYARAFGGLSTESFMKSITFQEIDENGLRSLGPVVARLADREQLGWHAESVRIRLAKLDETNR